MADASLQIRVDANDVKNASDQLGRLTETGKKTESAINSLSQSASNAGKGFGRAESSARQMRGTMQNLGYQLQDTAVQLQMGTSALTVLGQQGSQMASSFGPTGAVVGALIAVGAAIAGVAMNSSDASSTVKRLKDDLESLTKSQAELGLLDIAKAEQSLSKEMESFTARRQSLSMAEKESGLSKKLLNEITLKLSSDEEAAAVKAKELADMRETLTKITNGTSKSAQDYVKELEYEAKLVNASAVEAAILNAERSKGSALTDAEAASVRKSAEALEYEIRKKEEAAEAARNLESDEKNRLKQDKLLDIKKSQASAYIASVMRDAMTERQVIEDNYNVKIAKLDEYLLSESIKKSEYDAAEIAAKTAKTQQLAELEKKLADETIRESERAAETKKRLDQQLLVSQLQFGSEMLGVIEQNAKEGSGIQKAAFVAQKAMAAAQAIIQAESASILALQAPPYGLGPIAGLPMAGSIKAMGYASAAVIAAQGFAGMFDKGGNIPSGQWGIVGEYGPEIVKGPANVTSRKETAAMARGAMSGAGGGVVIQQNITVQGNGDEALISAMQEAAKQGAKDGYNQVRQDFATNGSIRRIAGV